mgnify:CR=1 FL=1|tara:strand:- start:161 stop:1192 length:1032 start_codon:yes stop_codon:yes gene_type:complete
MGLNEKFFKSADSAFNPRDHFKAFVYANTGTSTALSVGFAPDVAWFKERNGSNNHQLYDTIRGDDFALFPNLSDAQNNYSTHPAGDLSPTLTSTGITTPSVRNNGLNRSGGSYVAWCWNAPTDESIGASGSRVASTVKKNVAAGFSMVRYTGNGSNGTVGHGLDSAPELIIAKKYDGTNSWVVRVEGLGNGYLTLNQSVPYSSTTLWDNPNANTFAYTHPANGKDSNKNYIAYCFHSITGYQKIGTYNGSGGANKQIVTGFQPSYLLIKNYTNTGSTGWAILDTSRDGTTDNGNALFASSGIAEWGASSTAINIDFTSTGFTIQNGYVVVNGGSDSYLYLAIA